MKHSMELPEVLNDWLVANDPKERKSGGYYGRELLWGVMVEKAAQQGKTIPTLQEVEGLPSPSLVKPPPPTKKVWEEVITKTKSFGSDTNKWFLNLRIKERCDQKVAEGFQVVLQLLHPRSADTAYTWVYREEAVYDTYKNTYNGDPYFVVDLDHLTDDEGLVCK